MNIIKTLDTFIKDEDGAQVVEYALIIAVVSIGLVVALGDATTGLRSTFVNLMNRVNACFSPTGTCA